MIDLSKLRLTFVAGTLGQGGAERQLFYILSALTSAGAELQLLSLTRGEFWEEKIRNAGIQVIWVGEPKSKLGRLVRIVQELRAFKPTVVQSQHFYTNLYVAVSARLLSRRDVGAIRSDTHSEVQDSGNFLGMSSLRAPRLIAANSRAGIKNAIKLGLKTSSLFHLPNFVDTDYFKPAGRFSHKGVRLLAVGRLALEKRFDRFIHLIDSLRKLHELDVTGLIVGDGPERDNLQKLARELHLGPNVLEFKGMVADTRDAYRNADIFVLTSDYEGTPNVALEAMASGLPVISSRVGGVSDLITHGENGYLFDAGDDDSMLNTLVELVRNAELRRRVGGQARESVLNKYALNRLPVYLKDLYQLACS